MTTEEFQKSMATYQELLKTVSFELQQVDHGNMGGLSNQFIVSGLSAIGVQALIDYLTEKNAVIVQNIKDRALKQLKLDKTQAETDTQVDLTRVKAIVL